MSADAHDEGTRRRALSGGPDRPRLTWPPEVGEKIHQNTGWHMTSWSGEVRAVVDDRVMVVAVWIPRRGRDYRIENRIGPLPLELARRPKDE